MRRWARVLHCLIVITVVTGCSLLVDTEGQHFAVIEKGENQVLEYRLDVQVRDQIVMELRVKNISNKPVKINFRTAQEYDFVVEKAGEVIWRWSHEQTFAQILTSKTLQPGEELPVYRAKWNLEDLAHAHVTSGKYTLKAYFLGASKQIPVTQLELQVP